MNSKLFAILLSGLASILLIIGGGYLVVENLVQPQGYLFEGIVLASIGLLIGLMITIALSIGETIIIFGPLKIRYLVNLFIFLICMILTGFRKP